MELIACKNGIIKVKRWVYDKEKEKGEYEYSIVPKEIDVIKDSIGLLEYYMDLLQRKVTLEDNFTVRDWFKMIENYPSFQSLDCFMKSYLKEFHSCPLSGCIDPDGQINFITLERVLNFEKFEKQEELYECENYVSVYGESNDKESPRYGIELWELKNYLDIPMKLGNGSYCKTISDPPIPDIKYQYIDEKFRTTYTLYELIHSFIYEISFFGTPKERDSKGDELKQMSKDIEEGNVELKELKDIEELFNKDGDKE